LAPVRYNIVENSRQNIAPHNPHIHPHFAAHFERRNLCVSISKGHDDSIAIEDGFCSCRNDKEWQTRKIPRFSFIPHPVSSENKACQAA